MRLFRFRSVVMGVGFISCSVVCGVGVVAQTTAPATRPAAPPATTQPGQAPDTAPDARTQAIQDRIAEVAASHVSRTHGDVVWRQQSALKADFELVIGEKPPVAGTMLIDVTRGRVNIALKDGTVLLYDGSKVWSTSPSTSADEAFSRLDRLPLLVTAPFQLQTVGAKQTASTRRHLNGVMYGSFTLTLPRNHLRAEDRSHTCFWDTKSKTLRGISIRDVTTNASADPPAESQIALLDELKQTEGVMLPSLITLWHWSLEKGVHGDQVGKITVSNVSFITPDDKTFAPPPDSRELTPPDSR